MEAAVLCPKVLSLRTIFNASSFIISLILIWLLLYCQFSQLLMS
nr:MAG TPA: hypothetical protein [Caudoviricetes sp.]